MADMRYAARPPALPGLIAPHSLIEFAALMTLFAAAG
jgi:hypothetical protein